MNRRQRRKNKLGEFVQYGFAVEAIFVPGRSRPIDSDPFCDALIKFVEAAGLGYGGSVGGNMTDRIDAMSGYIERYYKTGHGHWNTVTCTDADRALVESWLRARVEIATVTVGPLRVID